MLAAEGLRVAPNVSATKVGWLLDQFDPERSRTCASARSTAGSPGT